MNILIVNGSPKGENSITLQTCLYIRKHFPAHNYAVLDAGSKVHSLQKDFSPALQALAVADLIIFSYPVYTFLAPSQLHSFISQMKTACSDGALSLEQFNAMPNGLICLKGGELEHETLPMKDHTYVSNLSESFDEEYFETKKVVHVSL